MAEIKKIGGSSTRWVIDATPEAKRKKIEELIGRPIKWGVIKMYEKHGKIRSCEICGTESFGGYWCRPCIHPRWCCECCILLGVPNYETAVFAISTKGEEKKEGEK